MTADTIQERALWLWAQLPAIRTHPAAADIHAEITQAHRDAVRVIDRPPQRVYAGPCDCGAGELLSWPGRQLVSCPACGATYGVQARQEWMRDQLNDQLATASEAGTLLPAVGVHVTPEMIRSWAYRHKIEQRPGLPRWLGDMTPPPRYRMGDIVRLALKREATKSQLTCNNGVPAGA